MGPSLDFEILFETLKQIKKVKFPPYVGHRNLFSCNAAKTVFVLFSKVLIIWIIP